MLQLNKPSHSIRAEDDTSVLARVAEAAVQNGGLDHCQLEYANGGLKFGREGTIDILAGRGREGP